MFYVSKISGNNLYITDTSDNKTDCFSMNDVKDIMLSSPDTVVKGIGVSMNTGKLNFKFTEYKLSEIDILKLSGAKSPICKFCRLPNESSSRNHYYCHNCGKLLNNKQVTCSCGAKFIYQGSSSTSKNYTVDNNGNKFYFLSVNGAKSMFRDKVLRY